MDAVIFFALLSALSLRIKIPRPSHLNSGQVHPLVYARVNSGNSSFVIALTTDSPSTFDVSTVRRSVQGMATCPHGYLMNRLLVAKRGFEDGVNGKEGILVAGPFVV